MMKRIITVLILSIGLAGCEKLLMPKQEGNTPTEVFEYMWKTIEEGYVYFGYKAVNWDEIYKEFKPKINDTMESRQLYDTCAQMLKRLMDPSVSLKTSFAESHYVDTTFYLPNFNRRLLERNYWKEYDQAGPFIHTVIDSIGYIYYSSFDDKVTDEHLDIVIGQLRADSNIRGVIFDVRDNRGGDINNAFTILKRMGGDTTFSLSAVLFKAFYKKGPERGDFTEAQTSYIEQSDKIKFHRKFVLLTNRTTMAEAALFATGSKGFNNVRVLGDTTGGRAGRIVGAEMPNGWILEYPASYFTTDDGRNLEDGVLPDKTVHTTPADEAQGKDAILEAALQEVKAW